MAQLDGQVVLVTGGGRGIGREIALSCAKQGAKVAVCSRTGAEVEEVLAALGKVSRAQAFGVIADVARGDEILRMVQGVEQKLGPIDGLVCAAGILGPVGAFEATDVAEWERVVQVNLFGSARCAHAVIPSMKKRGGGQIVFFSGGGQGAQPRRTAYVASKGAIWRLTESLGAELAPRNIWVNAIAPGPVNTRFLDDLLRAGPEGAGADEYAAAVKQRDSGGTAPTKAADLAVFLLSKRSAGLGGKVLSAVWDDYAKWSDLASITHSDLYTMKRVTRPDGGTR